MKTIFNKALWASAIGACTLSLGSCTDLSETIYDTIASEKYEFRKRPGGHVCSGIQQSS